MVITREVPEPAILEASASGIAIRSRDSTFALRIRGLVQADGRLFNQGGISTFLLRRVRPILEGVVYQSYEFRITPEFGGTSGTPTILDAFGNVHLWDEVQVRAGKFISPVGLERLQPASENLFTEFGLPENLTPNRDIGVDLHGDLFGAAVSYDLAILNGVLDGMTGDVDNGDWKDLAGRVFVRPFRPLNVAALRGLGVGFAATRGTHTGPLPPYRTPGQNVFFQYAGDAVAAGTGRRLAPQGYFYWGPFGIIAEWVQSSQVVSNGSATARLDHRGWQIAASVLVTGEDASYDRVVPNSPLAPAKGTFGAVELDMRYDVLSIDDTAFQRGFADSARSAHQAKSWGVGVQWHLARGYRAVLDYMHASFAGGASKGDREDESAFMTRLQAAF